MKKTGLIVFLVMTICFSAISQLDAKETVKIGVLAKNGPAKALSKWKATGDYLSTVLPDYQFEIVPLDFKDVNPAIEEKTVDFFMQFLSGI